LNVPCLVIDVELPVEAPVRVLALGALRTDDGRSLRWTAGAAPDDVAPALDSLAAGARFVVGHNVRRHDLPALAQAWPGLALHALPVLDTLELSPLAFPENPYHRLVKDYRLVSDARNDPLRDATLASELLADALSALAERQRGRPDELAVIHFLVDRAGAGGLSSVLEDVRGAPAPDIAAAAACFLRAVEGTTCVEHATALAHDALHDPARAWPLAYVVAWLRVAGGNSVLPPWVRETHPDTGRLVRVLRTVPCARPDCRWCRHTHDPVRQLREWFQLEAFRATPANAGGGSLQEDIVVAGLGQRSLLAILPTGGGKSLCYQLPALVHHQRTGALTVVISPLQSLMKDQIDNLARRGIESAVAINGLLTPPERKAALDRVRMGDAGMVLVSPEQFRNRSFVEAIRWREVATWVFDEAHCLSRWGHDFRTDYLYVARFVRQRQAAHPDAPPAVIACFTATAKPDVIADLHEHFRAELGVELAYFGGGHARTNLQYEVIAVPRAGKAARILELLQETVQPDAGGAVVFAATRRNAELLAGAIGAAGWSCAHFHAGLEPGTKRETQQAFIEGALRVIVATNAFGMGVDKPDIRLVVHADIPGSLENYLQEAGRAGRDTGPARCVLLYDEEDVEAQFGVIARSRLTHRDLAAVLRAARRRRSRVGRDVIVVTPRELLLEDEEAALDAGSPDTETRVRTAIAWLERARFLQREENESRVFPASLRVGSLAEADARMAQSDLPVATRARYRRVLDLLMAAGSEDGISTDDILLAAGIPAEECFRTLANLARLGLVANDLGLRAVLRKGVADPSEARLARVASLERALIDVLSEAAPDADAGETQVLGLRAVCEAVRVRLDRRDAPETVVPDRVLDALRALAQPFGTASAGRAMLTLRRRGAGELQVRVIRPWAQIRDISERRCATADVVLRTLLSRLPASTRSADAIVECKAADLLAAIDADLVLASQLRDRPAALEHALLHLHETGVLILDRGRAVFRSAMTLRLLPREQASRLSREDVAPLERHYEERTFQVHVMHEYARRAMTRIGDALALVGAYFASGREQFVRTWFGGQRELLELATTAESYRRIVESLRHPLQQHLVEAREGVNRLVIAGPGSGKTRVIVHRAAYLLRVLRIPAASIIVLAYNRSAAVEVRRRLRSLVGDDANGLAVLTYHAMAMRLTGTSAAVLAQEGQAVDFEGLLARAVALLDGRLAVGVDPDELRDRLLAGYRFILVDEYQDIDALQFELISALAGRLRTDGDAKLTIMAVGDDDQNIYAFRRTSVEFIHRFAADYRADTRFLVENYRSTQHIIAAANTLITPAPGRMKVDAPIRIDHARSAEPAGGRWDRLDPEGRGRVRIIAAPADANVQAQLTMTLFARLRERDPRSDWSECAVLARTHAALEPLRAWCERHNLPYRGTDRRGPVAAIATRQGQRVVAALRRRQGRLVGLPATVRWLEYEARRAPVDPWWRALADAARDFAVATDAARALPSDLLDWLHDAAESGGAGARGHLNLLTVHAAKGREFDHVVVLDAGDWPNALPEERRLLYVGMTRARETLALMQGAPRGNPLLAGLDDSESVVRMTPDAMPSRRPDLDVIHRVLGLDEVDLGFAGRQPEDAAVHAAIAALAVGDALRLDGRTLFDARGAAVGRLAAGCTLPRGRVVGARVAAIAHRSRLQAPAPFQARLRAEHWETVLPEITVDPAPGAL